MGCGELGASLVPAKVVTFLGKAAQPAIARPMGIRLDDLRERSVAFRKHGRRGTWGARSGNFGSQASIPVNGRVGGVDCRFTV